MDHQAGTPISNDDWNQQVLKAGFGDTSDPALNERRLFLESGKYNLKIWNGTEWKKINEYTAQEILTLLLTVDGSGSGLDADTLRGFLPNEAASYNTIVKRSGSGYIFANYFNTTCNNATNPTHLYGSQDTYIRKVTPSQLLTIIKTVDGSGSGLDADMLRGKIVQGGLNWASAAGYTTVFPAAFSSTPNVVATSTINSTIYIPEATVTSTQFKTYGPSTHRIHWVAWGQL